MTKYPPLRNTKLRFNAKKHTYRIGRKKLQSVTEWIKSFNPPFKPFDEQAQAQRLSETNNEQSPYYKKTPKQILRMWKKNADKGTCVHKQIEDYIAFGQVPTEPLAQIALPVIETLLSPTDRPYTELKICSDEIGLAGTIDLLIEHEDGTISLVDWKTNKTLYGTEPTEKTPYKQLTDTNVTKYCLQLSTYAFIMEMFYKRTIRALYLIHLHPQAKVERKIPYLRTTVTDMIVERAK